MNIGFIGAGNMGGAILRGYLDTAKAKKHKLLVFGVKQDKLERTCEETGATAYTKIDEIVKDSDVFLIGVKPGMYDDVMPQIASTYTKDKICISMAAGISTDYIASFLGDDAAIVRIMPNTPAQVGEGMTSVSFNKNVKEDDREMLVNIFRSIGKAEVVDEKMIHTVIGVSGSSPAYTYMYIDALAKTAENCGMDYEQAKIFAAQAVLGAAKMVLANDISPEQLRINVCSPGGTTLEAVKNLQDEDFEGTIARSFMAAVEKSKKMER